MANWWQVKAYLAEEEKAEMLEDTSSVELQKAFAPMNMSLERLSPLEWLDFFTQVSNLSIQTKGDQNIIKGDAFLL